MKFGAGLMVTVPDPHISVEPVECHSKTKIISAGKWIHPWNVVY